MRRTWAATGTRRSARRTSIAWRRRGCGSTTVLSRRRNAVRTARRSFPGAARTRLRPAGCIRPTPIGKRALSRDCGRRATSRALIERCTRGMRSTSASTSTARGEPPSRSSLTSGRPADRFSCTLGSLIRTGPTARAPSRRRMTRRRCKCRTSCRIRPKCAKTSRCTTTRSPAWTPNAGRCAGCWTAMAWRRIRSSCSWEITGCRSRGPRGACMTRGFGCPRWPAGRGGSSRAGLRRR